MEQPISVEDFLEVIHPMLEENQYFILPRDKNDFFMDDYMITEEMRKQILLSLTEMNFKKVERNNHPKFSGYVYIFEIWVKLIHRYLNEEELVRLYIKISNQFTRSVIIISFHA